VPFGGSIFLQRSATPVGLTEALRGKSAAMTGVVNHPINSAEKNLTKLIYCLSGPADETGSDWPGSHARNFRSSKHQKCLPTRAVTIRIMNKSQEGELISQLV
jgi:hypothetical protein